MMVHRERTRTHQRYNKYITIFLCALFFILLVLISSSPQAKVSGGCNNCHTMHNSQHGSAVARGDAPWNGSGGSTEARSQLLVASCLGCHSSTGTEAIEDLLSGLKVPIVFNTSGYPIQPLAGGNFFKISQGGASNDPYGHNIRGISIADNNLIYVPGQHISDEDTLSITDCYNCHVTSLVGVPGIPFTKSRNGNVLICEDCHIPNHHADDSATIVDEIGGWYRFLYDVKGIEDSDWEQTVSSTDHNEYQGETVQLSGSISDAGCACHKDFHALRNPSGVGSSSPWLRHPTDIALPTTGEYSLYTMYNPQVPVARPDLSGYSGPSETVTPGTDQVMCLSCHRAHGSEYFKILRWDYKGWPAGGGTNGCNICHSTKD